MSNHEELRRVLAREEEPHICGYGRCGHCESMGRQALDALPGLLADLDQVNALRSLADRLVAERDSLKAEVERLRESERMTQEAVDRLKVTADAVFRRLGL